MRILVVEDEKKVASFIRRGLEAEGHPVDVVHDGTTALRRALDEDYALVVLDVMLPGRDGLSVLRELRARGRRTPVLLLTARGAVTDKVAGLDGGADDCLTKPFEFAELLAVTIGTEGDRAVLEVRDDGPGIPSGLRDRVFGSVTALRGEVGKTAAGKPLLLLVQPSEGTDRFAALAAR